MINLKLTPDQAASAKVLREKKLTLKEINGELVLHSNDNVVKCAFLNPFPAPHPITGRVDFINPICSTACQFFNLVGLVDQNTGDKIETVFFDCVGCSKTVTPWKTTKGRGLAALNLNRYIILKYIAKTYTTKLKLTTN